jgi:hypothetical protein
MTERSELLESYYEELDPARRRDILASYEKAEGADDPVLSYRKDLMSYRYTDPKDPSRQVDQFMMALLTFMYIFKRGIIFPGRYAKEVRGLVRRMERNEKVHTDKDMAEAFKMEVRNAVRRYFDTCKSDSYHKKFFGIQASSADEKETQRCLDTWRMSLGIAERLSLKDEMALLCQAVDEEYRLSRADGLSLEEAYRKLHK